MAGEDLRITIGADIAAYQAAMQQAGQSVKQFGSDATSSLANAAVSTDALGGSAMSASMKFYTMRSGISAARDGVMAFTVGGQAAERSLLAMGHHITSLVNETGSFSGAMKALGSSLIGPGGIILGLTLAAELFEKFSNASADAAAKQTDYQKAVEQANKTATEQVSSLSTLYSAATNANLPMKERIAAVKELQSQYPAYFANMSQEAILAGRAASAYENLTQSIINQAVVKAGQEKLQEALKPLIDLIAEQKRLQAEVDSRNADIIAKNKQASQSNSGFRTVGQETPGFRTPGAGGQLLDVVGGNIDSQKKDLEKQIKDSQDSIQQMIQDFGINSVIDPNKGAAKPDEQVTGLDALKQKQSELKSALDDAAADNKPIDYVNKLAAEYQNLTEKINEAEIAIKKAIALAQENSAKKSGDLFPRANANKTDTVPSIDNSQLDLEQRKADVDKQLNLDAKDLANLEQLLQNKQISLREYYQQTYFLAVADLSQKQLLYNDDSAQYAQLAKEKIDQAKKLYDELTKLDNEEANQKKKNYDTEKQSTQELVSLIGNDFKTAFEKAAQGSESFGTAMEQAFEQLIEKLVAAVAEALVLYVIIQAIPGLSAAVGAAGSLTSLIGQTTGITKLMASMGSAGGANSGGGGSSGGADVPAYANGGIVTSAHIGIVGEAGPEAIIPLSRMSEFTGGAGGNFQVTHKVSGSDLLLVINRASKTQSRKS